MHKAAFCNNPYIANAKQQIQTRDLFVTHTAAELIDSNLWSNNNTIGNSSDWRIVFDSLWNDELKNAPITCLFKKWSRVWFAIHSQREKFSNGTDSIPVPVIITCPLISTISRYTDLHIVANVTLCMQCSVYSVQVRISLGVLDC